LNSLCGSAALREAFVVTLARPVTNGRGSDRNWPPANAGGSDRNPVAIARGSGVEFTLRLCGFAGGFCGYNANPFAFARGPDKKLAAR